MPIVKIDGKDYDTSNFNVDTKHQLTNLQITDQEIQRLQVQLAIAQTARNAYAKALSLTLPSEADAVKLN